MPLKCIHIVLDVVIRELLKKHIQCLGQNTTTTLSMIHHNTTDYSVVSVIQKHQMLWKKLIASGLIITL
ncbi:MAG: hypothetical protein CMQ15_06775 [Gammaproteobacteria bacterium]|nr:hypothetical protein [Gammaproteobacteria bacterium]